MSLQRFQRGVRQLGLGSGSRLARPPAVLPEPDIKPGPDTCFGEYFIEADPTNTYLSTGTGLPQGVVWDDSTELGGVGHIDYDQGTSLTFIQVPEETTVLDDGGSPGGSYVSLIWSPTSLAAGSVTIDVIFEDASATEITRFTDTNTNTGRLTVVITSSVVIPAGGTIRVEITHTGTPTTFTYGGELALGFSYEGPCV